MRRKTRILIALTYAAVFLVCFGALYLLRKAGEPGTAIQTEHSLESREEETKPSPETEETRTEASPSQVQEEPEEEAPAHLEYQYESWKQELDHVWTPPQEPEYQPPSVILATDLHYQSAQADDGGAAFQKFVESCDGKVVEYLPQLLEAFMDQVIEAAPTALVFSGDITMNGEKLNHEELAQKLERVQDAGIQVLIIPGNHDINNTNAAVYFGDEKASTDSVTPEEFYQIYRQYGYDQAFSRDSASLSYAYALDEKNWLIMLDSAQYDPVNLVEGRIREETLEWMDDLLAQAQEQGIFVIPIAHHNLLNQSRMYTTQCTMENNQQVVDLLQKYRLPLFFSGHLHVQRIRRYKSEPGVPDSAYGIEEIVTDALSIPPCQYGMLTWKEDGSVEYATQSVDVSSWARKTGQTNPDLLNFEDWSREYISKLISDQIGGVIRNLGTDVKRSMCMLYAQIYMDYYAGRAIDPGQVYSTKGYQWWERNLPDSYLLREIRAMMEDADRDNNYYFWQGEG